MYFVSNKLQREREREDANYAVMQLCQKSYREKTQESCNPQINVPFCGECCINLNYIAANAQP